jgi:hypothetical protein
MTLLDDEPIPNHRLHRSMELRILGFPKPIAEKKHLVRFCSIRTKHTQDAQFRFTHRHLYFSEYPLRELDAFVNVSVSTRVRN